MNESQLNHSRLVGGILCLAIAVWMLWFGKYCAAGAFAFAILGVVSIAISLGK
jgi:uncharacterized membrane protein